ncbi:hypothetical protein Z043_123857, partial [Scleropages formosus]
ESCLYPCYAYYGAFQCANAEENKKRYVYTDLFPKFCPVCEEEPEDPMMEVIGLQRADGSWDLQKSLASILGKREEDMAKASPGK